MRKKFLNLGLQPIANSFLTSKKKKEFKYNLSIGFNTKNFLVSLMKTVNPKKQYTKFYAHRASESKTMREAFKVVAVNLKKRFKPKLTMEIGSNDGVFIRNFKKDKIISIEPCLNLAKITKKNGFTTYPEFWDKKISKKIFKKYGLIDLVYSANTISHIPNLDETFLAIRNILSNKGVLVIEDPSLLEVIKNNTYDQFYDEHVYVFSAIAISKISEKYNLRLFDIDISSVHGGSIRYFICKKDCFHKNTLRLKKQIKKETHAKMNKFSTYLKFASKVKKSKKDLVQLLKKLKKNGKKIISYGATYKSTTIFNYCNLGKYIDYAIDTTKNKQGKFTPGQHLKILKPEVGFNETVDYAYLGAWNFKKEIIKKEKNYIKRGGKFITHTPRVKII
jgi:methylation protein EvaC|tara:strand:+ start:1096 stop:2268 length:1173 start_codon:yes stop_codon:yes gene_type:complete